ncbi:protoporphyrinogen oxidase [Kwoniella bestiolae CBS 10118]|uniref:Protoporphyrinogen oxidase n=1 Tax=Kwoniella bestiolae CBS 10118 TaxID=1296100 RepID=A0A1B9FVP4_9TREE|nr:protoporphyrinogen oxidase [Kwoniella bestiolae CBS 10118]OCF22846.1 protoporphyrinogen oxidase [Kwoniella bestiolae CBS 10118]
MPPPRSITILGGGLSGLTAAYKLSKLLPSSSGSKITLIESTNRIGGWINSQRHEVEYLDPDRKGEVISGEVTIESGPRSIRPRGSEGARGMLRLLKDLDLTSSILPILFSHPAAKNRFLLDPSTSHLTALPTSPLSLLSSNSPLLKGLLPSALKEPFHPQIQGVSDESVDSFFSRRLSPAIARNLASSMVHGIYAASSKDLSVRSAFPSLWDAEQKYGSVVVGMLSGGSPSKKSKAEVEREEEELGELGRESKKWSLYGLKGGLSSLTDRLYEEIQRSGNVEIRSNEAVKSIKSLSPSQTSQEGGNGMVEIETTQGKYTTDHIISALSSSTLSSLLSDRQSLSHLDTNPYTSVGVVNLVYPLPPHQIHPAGFGYLISRSDPSSNPYGVLGVIFDSTAIPLSTDVRGITKLTLMMGGPYWSSYSPNLIPPGSNEELIENSINHLNTVFPHLRGVEPILKLGKINWDCIPTYTLNHGQRLRDLHRHIRDGEWDGKLSLVGNAYGGVGLNDCIFSSEGVVKELMKGSKVTGLERWETWE